MENDPQLASILAAPEEPEACPDCGSTDCTFDEVHGYWECNSCFSVWAYDEDDPDYDELEPKV